MIITRKGIVKFILKKNGRIFMGKKTKKHVEKRLPKFWEAMIPLVALVVLLVYGKGVKNYSVEALLIIAAVIAAIIGRRTGHTWEEMEQEIGNKIKSAFGAIMILLAVGMIIGSWILSGCIPMMIYYGVKIINPHMLLTTAFIVCAVISVVTGTSWGSVGTMGVAIMGIAGALGVSLPVAAGAVLSGAYFGDKISPLSDTTNLAPMVSGCTLYEHIKHQMWTIVPPTVICLVAYTILGMSEKVSNAVNAEGVDIMMGQLDTLFNFNILLLLPAVIVLGGSLMRLPTTPIMVVSVAVASVESMIFQHAALGDVLSAMINGFNLDLLHVPGFDMAAIVPEINTLLVRGGLSSMMSTIQLLMVALTFAGMLVASGCTEVLLNKLLLCVKSTGGLIASTLFATAGLAFTVGATYLTIILPGELFRDVYKKRGLAPENLSRSLEDAGTVIMPLVPWSTSGVFMSSTLGVSVMAYLPWAFLCYLCIVFALIYGFTGIGIKRLSPGEMEDQTEAKVDVVQAVPKEA